MRVVRVLPWMLLALPLLLAAGSVQTVPLYSARENLLCQTCHVDPNGGGIRNEFGFNYAKNRHSLVPEEGRPWGEMTVANRIGENMPLYVGLNLREMLIATTSVKDDSLDRAAFFQMESALHFSFQPHSLLATNVTLDAFEGGMSLRDAYAIARGGPWNGYAKLGRFRTPFGLRVDDHTVATRNGFLDFTYGSIFNAPRYVPFDPRNGENGLELGASAGAFWGRAALTNGSSNPFFGSTFAQAKTLKLGTQIASYQGAVSFYDDFNSNPSGLPYRRATRWSYYGMFGFKPLALLGEVGAGTDDLTAGVKKNLLAGFGEANWQPSHPFNVRLRYDYLQADRANDDTQHQRYAVETEWSPFPFAELRLVYRRILHEDKLLDDESQVYLQGHLAY